MLISTLRDAISKYDASKGVFRQYFTGDESHVQLLQEFLREYIYAGDRLPDDALPKLGRIILSKTSAGQASSACFIEIADKFGGMDVLSEMVQAGLATPRYLAFVERHSGDAGKLVIWLKAFAVQGIRFERYLTILENISMPERFYRTFDFLMRRLDEAVKAPGSKSMKERVEEIFYIFATLARLGITADTAIFGRSPENDASLLPTTEKLQYYKKIFNCIAVHQHTLDAEMLHRIWNEVNDPAQFLSWLQIYGVPALDLLLRRQNSIPTDSASMAFIGYCRCHADSPQHAAITFLTMTEEARTSTTDAATGLGADTHGQLLLRQFFRNLQDAPALTKAWMKAKECINHAFSEDMVEAQLKLVAMSGANSRCTHPVAFLQSIILLAEHGQLDEDRLKRLCDTDRVVAAQHILIALELLGAHGKLDSVNVDSVMIDPVNGRALAHELCGVEMVEMPASEEASLCDVTLVSPSRDGLGLFRPGSPGREDGPVCSTSSGASCSYSTDAR